jgi:hypothetical protein
MHVLVDFDNLPTAYKRRDVRWLVDRIFESLAPVLLAPKRSARIRFYGGWYEENRPTRLAEALIREIATDFPTLIGIPGASGGRPFTASAELAYSLEADPRRHLFHTLRIRGSPPVLRVREEHACDKPDCPMAVLREIAEEGGCPAEGCECELNQVLYKAEQKLVDTMMTADLIELGADKDSVLCVVSSDDDLWPGIRVATLRGAHVVHVVNSRKNSGKYTATEPNYSRVDLR